MPQIPESEQKGLVDVLGVEEKDLFEAKYNLLGAFDVLYRIDQRLEKENAGIVRDLQHKI